MLGLVLAMAVVATPLEYRWRVVPIDGGGSIECVAVSPHDPALVMAGSDVGGFQRSTDGGRSWTVVNDGTRSDADVAVADIAFHPSDPDLVYAATGKCFGRPGGDYGGLLVSQDRGLTWSVRSRQVRFAGHGSQRQRGHVLVTDPFQPDRIWAATAWDGVMMSTDRGRTWVALGPADRFLVALGRTADGTLYAAAEPQQGQPGGVLVLRPGDLQWRLVYDQPVRDLAVAPSEPGRILITTPDVGLLLSEDAGRRWVNVTPAGFADRLRAHSVAFSPSHPRVAVATGIEKQWQRRHPDVYLTLDGGRTWQPMTTAPPDNVVADHWWTGRDRFGFHPHCVAFDPRMARRLWIGDWYNVWGSHDGAASWFSGHRGLRTCVVRHIALDPLDPNVAYLGLADIGAFRVEAEPLTAAGMGGNSTGISSVPGLAARRGPEGTTVYLAHGDQLWIQEELGRWHAAEGTAPGNLRELAIHPAGPLLARVEGRPLHISRDGGASWAVWGTPPTVGGQPLALSLPVWLDDAGRRAVAFHPAEGLFLTRDDGRSWGRIGAMLPDINHQGRRHKHLRAIAAQSGRPGVLYAANLLSVWRSLDEGGTWERVFPRPVRALTVDPASGRLIVAAAGYWYDRHEPGLYATEDRGETWSPLGGRWPVHRQINVVVADPRIPGRLWVGTQGNSAVVGDLAR